ncbi:polar amino acid transport system permease protein [Desulfohalotomaculum tongense]|uniref:amino acid ABC transporter permease n=1 Tax=Desulforadius tongensis TaxID=1216062 RepID=UPI00195E9E11|nr:amino acid ABC transporter permease [Desulforadius tongensis]MBM7854995.1 polar amino acid transport system permease protein [Desulforadius tongensis]
MENILHALPLMLEGAGISLIITAVGIILGSIIGLAAGLARLSRNKLVRLGGTAYVDFFRGSPLFVQIMLIYFGIPGLLKSLHEYWVSTGGEPFMTNFSLNIWFAAILSISLNSGAYIAEIFRAGVQSIEKGQIEAARSLGMNHFQAMRYVILPQAFKRVIPPMGNEFIMLLKETSLLSVIGFEELARKTQLEVARTYATFELWLTAAFIYLIMTFTFSRLVDRLEERLKTD